MTDRSIQVVMTENAWDGPTLLADGTTQSLTASLAGSLVQDGKARYVNPSDQTSQPGFYGDLDTHAAEHAAMGVGESSSMTPYKVAVYGDSRSNAGLHTTTTTASGVSGEKTAGQFVAIRKDCRIIFNGGISGDTAANWNSAARTSSSQSVSHLVASDPDLVIIQYGINDIIAGTSASTLLGYLQSLCSKIIGSGIPLLFESINPCSDTSVSYVNGVSASGGYGANAADKEVVRKTVNSAMESWLAGLSTTAKCKFVNTDSVTYDPATGFAKADKTYIDGTHLARPGAYGCGLLLNSASTSILPARKGKFFKKLNGVNAAFNNVVSGLGEKFSAVAFESGAGSAVPSVVLDEDGDWCQQYDVTITSNGGAQFAARFAMSPPDFQGASPFFSVTAGDVLGASIDYKITAIDGSGIPAIASSVMVRQRVYYNDATNEYTSTGGVSAAGSSTDYPQLRSAEKGRLSPPNLAVKTAMASANMLSTTSLFVYVYGTAVGQFRLQLKNPQWCKL